jgi:uroporphyrinogen decarboxylase
MNKRDLVLSLTDPSQKPTYTPAAFFLHFDRQFHTGRPAVEKHLEYFRYTGMDFVKIQFELSFPYMDTITKPEDWSKVPVFKEDFFDEPLAIIKGLVDEVKSEAVIVQTLYSPFMVAGHIAPGGLVERHIVEDAQSFKQGIANLTESLSNFVRAAVRAGIDGFYASTQGAEVNRFAGVSRDESLKLFEEAIMPYDLEQMNECMQGTVFNILHICDYNLPYDDLAYFTAYPGQVVNSSLELTTGPVTPQQVSSLFNRPFMGGLNRKGILATGTPEQVAQTAEVVLSSAPERFILAADCTVPAGTPWDNLKAAINAAHARKL